MADTCWCKFIVSSLSQPHLDLKLPWYINQDILFKTIFQNNFPYNGFTSVILTTAIKNNQATVFPTIFLRPVNAKIRLRWCTCHTLSIKYSVPCLVGITNKPEKKAKYFFSWRKPGNWVENRKGLWTCHYFCMVGGFWPCHSKIYLIPSWGHVIFQ